LFPDIFGEISFWFWYFSPGIATVVTWRVITKWARKNRNKIKGRIFEMFFFFFLFLSTYTLTFILKDFMREVMGVAFIFSIISAGYCGLLHYREGIFTKNYWKPKLKKKKNK